MKRILIILLVLIAARSLQSAPEKPNVLFIIADDMMKQVDLYGYPEKKTPELMKLSEEAMLLDRAYCQYPLCGPSRAALMLSKYPDKTGILWNQAGKSNVVQQKAEKLGITTMPAYFKQHGYITVGGGKLYHNSVIPNESDTLVDFTVALSPAGHDGVNRKVMVDGKMVKMTAITEASEKAISEHKDGAVVKQATEWLSEHASSGNQEPFFMCIGIKKPHSPYSCPESFWEEYQRANMVPNEIDAPNDIIAGYSLCKPDALLSVHYDTMEYDAYTLPEEKKLEMVHGYSACVAYTDHLVGQLVDSLKANGYYDNTIIVFTSDHGYKLGEYHRWAKYTLHEKDAVVPFLVRAPGHEESFGQKTNAIVGLIDIYPTLADLCGIPIPDNIDGRSFARTLSNPESSARKYIRTVLPRKNVDNLPSGAGVSIMHENGYRYHHWWEGELDTFPEKDQIVSYELYDHYNQNNTPLSLKNIYKEQPELLEEMRILASEK